MRKEEYILLIKEVQKVGEKARAYFDSSRLGGEIKSDGSVITSIDEEIEAVLVSFIKKQYPEDSIIREEGKSIAGTSRYVWHIDPIDGTDNFYRRIPFCAISIARLGDTDEESFALIYNPITEKMYVATTENGVRENSQSHTITDTLIGGRAFITFCRGREEWMKSAVFNLSKVIGLRFGKAYPLGCCALEFAYVASNRTDGVLTFGLSSYDYAAGLFLVRVGGGVISVHREGEWQKWDDSIKELCQHHGETIFASHSGIHNELVELISNPREWSDI